MRWDLDFLAFCSEFEVQNKILGPKWDTLRKHGGRRKAKVAIRCKGIKIGNWYRDKLQALRKQEALYSLAACKA
jgi:hypothetical protein